jgi:hypothetical protein
MKTGDRCEAPATLATRRRAGKYSLEALATDSLANQTHTRTADLVKVPARCQQSCGQYRT